MEAQYVSRTPRYNQPLLLKLQIERNLEEGIFHNIDFFNNMVFNCIYQSVKHVILPKLVLGDRRYFLTVKNWGLKYGKLGLVYVHTARMRQRRKGQR